MRPFVPLGMLVVAGAWFSALQVAYVAIGTTPSEAAAGLTSAGVALAFVIWVVADARARQQTPCYDFGFLVAVFFPASLCWYVVWSRGWRGMLMLAALL